LTAALCASCAAQPETVRSFPAVRVNQPPVIDGALDDACWAQVPYQEGFTDEQTGQPMADDTRVWICYDSENIYVAFHAFDSEPHRIRAVETRREAGFVGEDRLRLRLDTFNSKTSDYENRFTINALGTQNTRLAGGRANRQEWEGVWKSAARIVDDGWTAEMAIPWDILIRPETGGNPVTMGLNFERYIARLDVECYWSNIGPRELPDLNGEWVGVVPPPAKPLRPLSVLAYTLGGWDDGRGTLRSGLDVRYQLSAFQTAVFSVNPDFSNVEGAVTSIDFSYSEKLPDERRPFFLEGSGYFTGALTGFNPFRSVRIPQFDAGARLFGRFRGGVDLGIMRAENIGDRRDTVARVEKQFSPFSSAVLQYVERDEGDRVNRVAVAAGSLRRGDWRMWGGVARSEDAGDAGDYSNIALEWSSPRYTSSLALVSVSPQFRPRNGFINHRDQRGAQWETSYALEPRTGLLRRYDLSVSAYSYSRYHGGFFREGWSAQGAVSFRAGHRVSASWTQGRFEERRDAFFSAGWSWPELDRYHTLALSVAWGTRAGKDYRLVRPSVTWRFFDRLTVSASSEQVRVGTSARQDILSVSYQFAPDRYAGGRLVRSGGDTNWYLSLSRSGYGGLEYFLILGDPNSRSFTDRLLLKVVKAY
jgi:hypothetical protein